jgi:hypothetical protein
MIGYTDKEQVEAPKGARHYLSLLPPHELKTLSPLVHEMYGLTHLVEGVDKVSGTMNAIPEAGTDPSIAASPEGVSKAGGAACETPWRSSVQFVEAVQKEITWLIPGVLPAGAVVLLSGREGSMKSYLALHMAHAVATGAHWLGRQTKQGPVLYLDGEMPVVVLKDRLKDMGLGHGLHIWSWTDETFPYQLGNSDLRRGSQEHSLIVVDTLRRHMEGKKENSSDDMAMITKDLRELTRDGATVLVLHHALKNSEKQGYRGATELGAGVDITMTLTKKETKSGAVLTLGHPDDKTRYARTERLEIDVTKGKRGPVFTVRDPEPPDPKRNLLRLCIVVNELRAKLGHDPNKGEVIQAAVNAGIGGRSIVDPLLKEGEGVHWSEECRGRTRIFAPLANG